jgi:GTP-sensing pleiotropic transcriptional regulator CodY
MINWKKVAKIFWKRLKIQSSLHELEIKRYVEMLNTAVDLIRCEFCTVHYATYECNNYYFNYNYLCDKCFDVLEKKLQNAIELNNVAAIRDINAELKTYTICEEF